MVREVPKVSGSFVALGMTANKCKNNSRNKRKQEMKRRRTNHGCNKLSLGTNSSTRNGDEIRGLSPLRADDEAVRRFGRDDVLLAGGESVVIG